MNYEKIAENLTTRAALTKNYLIRNKHNRAMRDAAARMLLEGGYFYGTEAELREHYADTFAAAPFAIPQYSKEVTEKRYWAILWNITWKRMYFVLV